jgi:pimeloyl-ACP methyl ester carboxylesterase
LVPDMPDYGRSAKPVGADYSVRAHVQRLLALCDEHDIRRAISVGHDLGGHPAAATLVRWSSPDCRVDVLGAAFLNSSLYHHLYQPALIQRLMAVRPVGRLLARRLSGRGFVRSLRKVCGAVPPGDALLQRIWQLFSAGEGQVLSPESPVHRRTPAGRINLDGASKPTARWH